MIKIQIFVQITGKNKVVLEKEGEGKKAPQKPIQ